MERICGTTQFFIQEKTAVAIGKFDGVHVGHQKLITELLKQKEKGLKTCVFTFDPSPAQLFGFSDPREINTLEEKRELLEKMGVDILIEYPLTKESAAIDPVDFVTEILVKQMQTSFIAAGEDLSFGKGGKGDWKLLEKMGPTYGFAVEKIEKVRIGELEISSTYIRGLLEKGEMEKVQEALGRPFFFAGEVVHGNHLGRTLGFPTVNLNIDEKKLLPPFGVYATRVWVRGKAYDAISNVGQKPTVSEKRVPNLESYLYDFNEEIYGEKILVELYHFRRPEMHFTSVEELRKQLEKDKLRK